MDKPAKRKKPNDKIELNPRGWERFEAAVNAAMKSGPQPRPVARRKSRKNAPSRLASK